MSDKIKDLLIKAFNTFWQASLGFLILAADPMIEAVSQGDWGKLWAIGYALLLGAIAAGLSAVKTWFVAKYKMKNNERL